MNRFGWWVAVGVLAGGLSAVAGDDPKKEEVKPTAPYAHRAGELRAKLLAAEGGTKETEEAVERGLAWLAKQQRKDGAWAFDGAAQYKNDTVTATAMGVLAFLGAGHTHHVGKYQPTVRAGLKHLAGALDKNGKFVVKGTSYMYMHGIATMALCEAYGMTKDPALKRPAQAALTFLQRGQGVDGSWGYTPNTNGDTSITGWQVQALTAARLAKDLPVDDKVLKKTSAFLDKVGSGPKRAVYGYNTANGAAPGTALTAIGLLSRTALDGWQPNNPAIVEGVEGQLKRSRVGKALPDMYWYYYATQLVRYAGGPEWETWNAGPEKDGARQGGMRDLLLGLQVSQGGATGSWDPDPGFIGQSCGRHGTTCLCLLTLEVYYRHAPPPRMAADPAK